MYYYQVYGLVVQSEVEWSELMSLKSMGDVIEDVKIRYDESIQELRSFIDEDQDYYYQEQRTWFNIDQIAVFDVRDGKYITIYPYPDSDMNRIKQYLYGICLGIVLLQRNELAIHGGSVEFNGNGLIIMGDSGAGKSTLTTSLRVKGHSLISDDISVIQLGDTLTVASGFPQQRLTKNSMKILGYDLDEYQYVETDNIIKYLVPTLDSFNDESPSVKVIVELKISKHVNEVKIERLEGSERFRAIYKNLFLIDIKQYIGLDPSYFKKCVNIAEKVPVYRMIRPTRLDSIKEQISCIESLEELQFKSKKIQG